MIRSGSFSRPTLQEYEAGSKDSGIARRETTSPARNGSWGYKGDPTYHRPIGGRYGVSLGQGCTHSWLASTTLRKHSLRRSAQSNRGSARGPDSLDRSGASLSFGAVEGILVQMTQTYTGERRGSGVGDGESAQGCHQRKAGRTTPKFPLPKRF